MRCLTRIFQILKDARLRINPKKSAFARGTARFLGFIWDKDGTRVDPSRLDRVRNMRTPENTKQVRQALGLFSFYRRFLRSYGIISAPLRQLLLKETPFHWGPEHTEAFEKLKSMLLSEVVLTHPDTSRPFAVMTDASSHSTAGVLLQEKDGFLRPVSFASFPLKSYQKSYSATHLELLALVNTIGYFYQYLFNHFTVYSDHISLIFLSQLKNSKNHRLMRYAILLSVFSFDIKYVGAAKVAPADTLSRYPLAPGEGSHRKIYVRILLRTSTIYRTCHLWMCPR